MDGAIQFEREYKKIREVIVSAPTGNDNRAGTGITITAQLAPIKSLHYQQFGKYYATEKHFNTWAKHPTTLETFLDDLSTIPSEHTRSDHGECHELLNTSFLVLARKGDLGAGLIVLPEANGSAYYQRIGMFKGFPLSSRDGYGNRRPERERSRIYELFSKICGIIILPFTKLLKFLQDTVDCLPCLRLLQIIFFPFLLLLGAIGLFFMDLYKVNLLINRGKDRAIRMRQIRMIRLR